MKLLEISPIIAIALLAACKSTDSVAEKNIDICFDDSQKTFADSSCFDPQNSSCTVEFQENLVRLIKKTAYEHSRTLSTWVTITNGGVTVNEEFMFFGNAKLTELCSNYKNDSTKRNVECISNIISYSIDGLFSDHDLKNIADQLYVYCKEFIFSPQKQCRYIQNRQNKTEDDGIPDLNLENDFFE
jgi:hypothetical protein